MANIACLSGSADDRVLAIVGRCGGGREGKKGWMVCCPAHEDRNPSLSITAKGDHVLLRCFAGCTPEAIVHAIALSMCDLFADEDEAPAVSQPAVVRKLPKRKDPPAGRADPLALAFAVDLVIDDVEMLTVEGLVTVLRHAASDPLQWLWLERAFEQAGMTPSVIWQVLFPTTECPYTAQPKYPSPHTGSPTVTLQGRPIAAVRLGRNRSES
jgi:hypothetical protein